MLQTLGLKGGVGLQLLVGTSAFSVYMIPTLEIPALIYRIVTGIDSISQIIT